jgi:hypothetical protein
MTGSRSAWRGAIVTGVAVLIVLLIPARADASDESRLLALTNQVRASNGLAPLTIDGQLAGVAQRWAATLAERGVISHNASLPAQLSGWKVLGENVGVGGTVDAIHAGWVGSPTHHQNLVDPAFTKVGFGIVRPDARIFVVQVFMQPKAPAASAPSPTVPIAAAKPVSPSAAAPVSAAVQAPVSAAPAGELSPWMERSLDWLRSVAPAKP